MKKKTKEDFIISANKINGNDYNYSNIEYLGNKVKINIFCNNCETYFWQRPDNHLSGAKCFNCYGNHKYTNSEFITKCNKKHDGNYIYDETIYDGMNKEIIIKCKIHGAFTQNAQNHLNGQGCIKCSHIIPLTVETIIEKSKNIFGNKYDYSSVNIIGNNKGKIKIICKEHGIFEKTINNHLNGQGCPSCRIYKGENIIETILIQNNISFERNKSFEGCIRKRKLYFDFYLIDYNICIELNGNQHYRPIEKFGGEEQFIIQKEIDNIKRNFCKDNNMNLIEIEYNCISIKFINKIKRILYENGIKIDILLD